MSTDRVAESAESTMRLFFAVPFSPSLAARIAEWRDALRLPRVAAPVPAADMHITLAFLGDVPRDGVPALLRLGARVASREARGELVLDRVHCWRNGVLHLAPSAKGHDGEGRFHRRSNPGLPVKTLPSQNRFQCLSDSQGAAAPNPTAISSTSPNSSSPISHLSTGSYPPTSISPTETNLGSIPSTNSLDEQTNLLAVQALAAALAAELKAEDVPFDKRKFSAHVTLARRAERVRARAHFRVPVTSLVLYVSQADERGVGYTALGEWQLRGGRTRRMSAEEGNWEKVKADEEKGNAGQRRGSCLEEGNAADRGKEGQLVDVDSVDEVDTELKRILGVSDSCAASQARPP